MKILIDKFITLFSTLDINFVWIEALASLAYIITTAIIAIILFITVKLIITKVIVKLILRTKITWDDAFVENKFFDSVSHLAPAIVIASASPIEKSLLENAGFLNTILGFIAQVYFIYTLLCIGFSFLNSVRDIYNTLSIARERPIKGYLQLIKIIMAVFAAITFISLQFNMDIKVIFTGLGTMAAVIVLIFRDSILGFVASIQLTVNNMVKLGDWIEVKDFNADGTVEDISLTTVKVQNWDKTISTIPTHELVARSVKNWKGMEESEGRRIKRSITIDLNSVSFCTEEQIERLSKIEIISRYIANKERSRKDRRQQKVYEDGRTDNNDLTNIGLFRHYIRIYLKNHPLINKNMTFIVRQLQPSDTGIPIEIYVFSKRQDWVAFEAVQADIFDHIIAISSQFNIRLYQSPSSHDIQNLITAKSKQ